MHRGAQTHMLSSCLLMRYTSEFQSGRKDQDRPQKAFVAILGCLGTTLGSWEPLKVVDLAL